jgi:hypothetical protein
MVFATVILFIAAPCANATITHMKGMQMLAFDKSLSITRIQTHWNFMLIVHLFGLHILFKDGDTMLTKPVLAFTTSFSTNGRRLRAHHGPDAIATTDRGVIVLRKVTEMTNVPIKISRSIFITISIFFVVKHFAVLGKSSRSTYGAEPNLRICLFLSLGSGSHHKFASVKIFV